MRTVCADVGRGTLPLVWRHSMTGSSLQTQLLFAYGEKLTSKQLLNPNMLAAYEAHVAAWRLVPENATWLILEDDAVVEQHTIKRLQLLLHSLKGGVDFINLWPFREVVQGSVWSNASVLLRECPSTAPLCHVLGQVAYIITYQGAQLLLRHALPPELPIDWYTESVHMLLDHTFRHTFTASRVFGHAGKGLFSWYHCFTIRGHASQNDTVIRLAPVPVKSPDTYLKVRETTEWSAYNQHGLFLGKYFVSTVPMNALLSHAHHVSSLAKVNAIVNYRSRFARTPKDLKMLGPSKPLPISKKKRPSAEEIKPRSMKKPRVDKGKSRAYRCSVSTLASRAGKYGDLTLENITEMKPVIMLIADD
eukprot:3816421-Rhodomonas_salina.1